MHLCPNLAVLEAVPCYLPLSPPTSDAVSGQEAMPPLSKVLRVCPPKVKDLHLFLLLPLVEFFLAQRWTTYETKS